MEENSLTLHGKKHVALGILLIFILYVFFLRGIPFINAYLKDLLFPNEEIISTIVLFGVTLSLLSLLWFVIVPKMGYPLGRSNFKEYLTSIHFKKINNSAGKNIILGIICFIIVFVLCTFINIILGVYKFNIETILPPTSWAIMMAISPGVFEEIAFRGVFLTMLLKKFEEVDDVQGEKKALIISSVLFGCAHFINIFNGFVLVTLAQVFYASFMGLILGALVLKSNSLLPAIVLHYLIDAFAPLLTNTLPLDPFMYVVWGILMALIGMGPVPAFICLKLIGWKSNKMDEIEKNK